MASNRPIISVEVVARGGGGGGGGCLVVKYWSCKPRPISPSEDGIQGDIELLQLNDIPDRVMDRVIRVR